MATPFFISTQRLMLSIVGISALLFPRLALGLSGFETGVAVMPLIECENLDVRIRNTRKLLKTAAMIMSVFLMATSIVTTLLIPAADFQEGGPANGRAMAFLAHMHYVPSGRGIEGRRGGTCAHGQLAIM